ncbi:MAG: sugar phosphate isomerase/epimerase [Ruminococcaceae bacterium]|nr:sugar phosphate isomerase/epimerase [Oscillospiraceae bacterium]
MIRLSAFSDEAGESLDTQIMALERNRISLMELRSVDGKNIKEITLPEVKEIKKKLSSRGIDVWAIGSMLGKTSITVDFDKYTEDIKHICECAGILETKRIRMFSFFDSANERNEVIEYLSRMVEIADEYGLYLCHENEKKVYGETLERVLDLKKSVKGLRLVYDPANFLQVGENPEDTLSALHSDSDYFHIKDAKNNGEVLVPAGYGDADIPRLIDMIDDDKVLTLEPHLKVFGGYNKIDGEPMEHMFEFETNEESFDFAAKSLKEVLNKCGYTEKGYNTYIKGE